MNISYPDITVKLWYKDWHLKEEDVSEQSLRELRKKLSAFYDRAEDHARYAWKVAEEDGDFLPLSDYIAIENAYDRMYKLMDAADDAIDAIDEALDAWDKLERNLNFVYRDCAEALKKAV